MKNDVSLEQLSIDIPLEFSIYELAMKTARHYHLKRGNEYTCSNCGSIASDAYPVCPLCRCDLKLINIRKNTNFEKLSKEFWIITLQKTNDRIVERWFLAYLRINIHTLAFQVFDVEVERNTIINGQTISICKDNYSKGWIKGFRYHDGFMGKTVRHRIEVYPKYSEIKEWLKDSSLKYTTIGDWLEQNPNNWNEGNHYMFRKLVFANKYPWIEKVYKSGLTNLWNDLISSDKVDFRRARPSKIIKYRQMLLSINATYTQFYAIDKLTSMKQTFSLDLIKKMKHLSHVNQLIEVYEKTKMPINRIMNYVYKSANDHLSFNIYVDYLKMMEQLYSTELSEHLVFPKDLQKAHDDAVQKFNAIKREKELKEWDSIKEKMKKYVYKNSQYAIVIPLTANDVLQEGQALEHCVGSYLTKIIKGKTTILFVRDVSKMDEPLYTLEYSNQSIVQCRGYQNKSAPDEIMLFLKEWERKMKKRAKKKIEKSLEIAAVS